MYHRGHIELRNERAPVKIVDILPQLTILPLRKFADAWDVAVVKSDNRDVFIQAIGDKLAGISSEAGVNARLRALERSLDYSRHSNANTVLRLILDQPGYAADESTLVCAPSSLGGQADVR